MNIGSFVRRFLAQQATTSLREQAARAAQQGSGERADAASSPAGAASTGAASARAASAGPAPACDVGIVFALREESGGCEDLLTGAVATSGKGFAVQEGMLGARRVALVRGGAGREAAARATQALIAGHRPRWIISAGFTGGLQTAVARNDIVMASEIIDLSGRRLSIDLQAASDARSGLHVGRLLTVDHIVRDPAEKAALGQTHQALAADMESWAVGEVCRQDKVRFMAIRVVSDAVDDALPADLDRLIKPASGAGRAGAVIGTLFRRPSSIKDMLRLREAALIASDRLANFLSGVVQQLVEDAPAS